jgi:thioredoxin 1
MTSALMNELTGSDFDAAVARGVTLVDFWAPWCGPCRMQTPVLEQLAADFQGRATVAKVNVDDNPHLAGRFRVSGIPLLVVIKDGAEATRLVGLQSYDTLSDTLNRLL